MSPSPPLPSVSSLREAAPTATSLRDALAGLRDLGDSAAVPVRAAAFYAAIVLPFVYIPLLVGGVDTGRLLVVVGLLLANAGALVLGHDYAA